MYLNLGLGCWRPIARIPSEGELSVTIGQSRGTAPPSLRSLYGRLRTRCSQRPGNNVSTMKDRGGRINSQVLTWEPKGKLPNRDKQEDESRQVRIEKFQPHRF